MTWPESPRIRARLFSAVQMFMQMPAGLFSTIDDRNRINLDQIVGR